MSLDLLYTQRHLGNTDVHYSNVVRRTKSIFMLEVKYHKRYSIILCDSKLSDKFFEMVYYFQIMVKKNKNLKIDLSEWFVEHFNVYSLINTVTLSFLNIKLLCLNANLFNKCQNFLVNSNKNYVFIIFSSQNVEKWFIWRREETLISIHQRILTPYQIVHYPVAMFLDTPYKHIFEGWIL